LKLVALQIILHLTMYRAVHHTLTMEPLYRTKNITTKLDYFPRLKLFLQTIQQNDA